MKAEEVEKYVKVNLRHLNISKEDKKKVYSWTMTIMEDLNIIDRGC